MRSRKLPVFFATSLLLLSACAGKSKTTKKPVQATVVKTTAPLRASRPVAPEAAAPGSFRRVRTRKGTKVYIVTQGVGYPDPILTDKQHRQRRNKSKRDALVEAQSKMLSTVSDFLLKGGLTVAQKMKNEYQFVTKVNDAVNGAVIEKQDCSPDDTCTVTIRLDKKDFEKVIGMTVLQ